MIKVYIAGSSKDTATARALAFTLERTIEQDIQVTHAWWDQVDVARLKGLASGKDLPPNVAKACAQADLDGIDACHVLILLASLDSFRAAFETGYALSQGKMILQIGTRGRIWEQLPSFRVLPDNPEIWQIELAIRAVFGR